MYSDETVAYEENGHDPIRLGQLINPVLFG